MCGIGGILFRDQRSATRELMEIFNSVQRHRGPDGEGVLCDHEVGLAHRRLAIIDLSDAGAQPMSDVSGRYAISFNGEIYNFAELRKELEQDGFTFRSRTDTEVVLNALIRWGAAAFSRFEGMWGLAFLDRSTRSLLLSRDRFGIKPLYVRVTSDIVLFASELKAIVAVSRRLELPVEVNLARLAAFVANEPPEDANVSFLSGIRQLQPGSWIEFNSQGQSERRFYDLADATAAAIERIGSRSEGDLIEEYGALFGQAVRSHLVADVPVGSCLSGGLDSSAIVGEIAIGHPAQARQFETFSACYTDPRADESSFIDAVANFTGVLNKKTYPSLARLLEDTPRLAWHQDEPMGSASMFAQWCVFSEAAASGVKVMLDGQGADEVLGGYDGYFVPLWLDHLRSGNIVAMAREMFASSRYRAWTPLSALALTSRWVTRLLAPALTSSIDERRVLSRRRISARAFPIVSVLNSSASTAVAALSSPLGSFRGYSIAKTTDQSLLELLRYEDRNSMAFSIESRVPFLHHPLVEYTIALPYSLKLRSGITKTILRNALQAKLPVDVQQRKDKKGFPTPWSGEWIFSGAIRDHLKSLTSDSRTKSRGWFDVAVLNSVLEGRSTMPNSGEVLWALFATEHWARAIIDQS